MLKKLELAWKALWLAVLCRIVRIGAGSRSEPAWDRDPCRVLFLRPDRLGDAIVSTGLFREIVSRAPNVTLDVVGSPRNRAILERDSRLGRVHVFDRKRWTAYPAFIRELRGCRYDAVVDCMVTAPSMTTLLLMLASGARHRIGIAGRSVEDALTIPVAANSNAEHIIEHLAAFGALFGADVAATDWRPELTLSDEERAWATEAWGAAGPRILINVSAGKPTRNWPEPHFAAAIAHIRSRHPDSECLVIGAPAESDRVDRIADSASVRALRTPILENALALVGTADFLLTPDTSIAHMASALGTPTVAMYLRGTGRLWGLYGAPGISLECETGSLNDLPLSEVLAAVDQVLNASVGTNAAGAKGPT